MPASLGKLHVQVIPDASQAVAVIIAATRLHEALFYSGFVRDLPDSVQIAYGELQHALNQSRTPSQVVSEA